jgi:hypothetical protein
VQLNHRKWLLVGCAAALISIGLGACSQQTSSSQAKAAPSGVPAKTPAQPAAATPQSAQQSVNPDVMCTSDDATQTVKHLIADEAKNYVHSDKARALLASEGFADTMEIGTITVAGINNSIAKVSCEAQLSIHAPDDLQKQFSQAATLNNAFADHPGSLGSAAPAHVPMELVNGGHITIDFSAQPTADGTDVVYSLNDVVPPARAVALLADTAISSPQYSQ